MPPRDLYAPQYAIESDSRQTSDDQSRRTPKFSLNYLNLNYLNADLDSTPTRGLELTFWPNSESADDVLPDFHVSLLSISFLVSIDVTSAGAGMI